MEAQKVNTTLQLNATEDDLRDLHLTRVATRSELIDGAAKQALVLTTHVARLVEAFREELNKRVGAAFANIRCEGTSRIMLSSLH